MNMFTVQLLQMLQKYGKIGLQEIQERLKLTRRMVFYYQKQLNDFLQTSELGTTVFRDDVLYLESSQIQNIPEALAKMDTRQYYLEASERQECILIKIGVSGRPQFLDELAEEFHISRRTFTNDLICLKEYLQAYGVQLLSRQKQGYYLSGDELTIRYLLLNAYHHRGNICIDHIKKGLLLEAYQYYCPETVSDTIFEQIRQILIDSEAYCKEKFIYFSLPDLTQTILLICLRGKKVSIGPIPEKKPEFEPAIEYIETQLEKLNLMPSEKEHLYFWLVLQSAKLSSSENAFTEMPVSEIAEDILSEFQQISGLRLSRSSEVYEMFMLHIRSMYYRTRYRIKITDLYDESIETDQTFFYLTRKVMEKISTKYDLQLDDGEIQFISYYLFCLSSPYEDALQETKANIVIVCVSGLGSSVYIRYQVSRLLGHSFSIIISDLGSLNQVLNKNTRLIISTLDIQTEYTHGIRVIKVSTILTPVQKKELIDWLLHEEVYLQNNGMVSDLLNIIKEHAVIQEQEKLFLRLNNYFRSESSQNQEPKLTDLLLPELIQILNTVSSWEEGIHKASLPLLKKGFILDSYVTDMLGIIQKHGPYCEFVNGMLLAHAEPKGNVRRPAIGLAVFHSPVFVPEWDKKIYAIFILGITEENNHASALSELIANLSVNETYRLLPQMETTAQIYQALTGEKIPPKAPD